MKKALPIYVAFTHDSVGSPAELGHILNAIAGEKIVQHVGAIMTYSYGGEIQNLNVDIPLGALSSADYPGVYVF